MHLTEKKEKGEKGRCLNKLIRRKVMAIPYKHKLLTGRCTDPKVHGAQPYFQLYEMDKGGAQSSFNGGATHLEPGTT